MTFELIKAGENRRPKLCVAPNKFTETFAFIDEKELDSPEQLTNRFPTIFLDCDERYFRRNVVPRLRRGETVTLPRRRWHSGD